MDQENKNRIDDAGDDMSQTRVELRRIEAEIIKTDRIKSRRVVLLIVGALLSGWWFIYFISTDVKTQQDPTSVEMLGPIFSIPVLMIGGLFFLVGIAGFLISRSRLTKLESRERSLSVLLKDRERRTESDSVE